MKKRTHYTLVGKDGNAFAIMGYVSQCMKREGKSKEDIDSYFERAKSSDYTHLLGISQLELGRLNNPK